MQGKIKISPAIIMTGGEYLSNELRKKLSETFHCYVQTNYSCTEGGVMACECRAGHLHINEDWVIIEPVDKNNHPVSDGILSDKILLTNLSNFTQPMIRFEITDRIIMHHGGCTCGKNSPWLEIEGRNDEILEFSSDSGIIRIAPLALYALLKEVHEMKRFQLIQMEGNRLELRFECDAKANRNEVFNMAKKQLETYLAANEIYSVSIVLSEQLPQPHPQSGKFKHVY